jgi:hypothetical protein
MIVGTLTSLTHSREELLMGPKKLLFLVLPGAMLLAALCGSRAQACDIKIHEAAYKQWPREFYLLYMVHDNKSKLSPKQTKMAKDLREKHFENVNADVIKLNRDGSMLREDREFLSAQGCGGWPQLIIFAKDGKVIARASGKLGKRELRYLSERAGIVEKGAKVTILYKKSDARSKERADAVTEEKLAKADLKDLKIERLDADDAKNKKLAEKFKPPKLPIMFLVSPRGHLLATYAGDIKEKDLVKSFDSPGRKKLTKALDKTAMTFVVVGGKDKKAAKKMAEEFKKPLAKAAKLFKLKLELVEIDGTAAAEKTFVKNLGVTKFPSAVPVFGKGKHLEPMTGKIKSDEVLARTQFMIQNCTCVLNPSALGEDLMLKWKGIDEKVKEE